MTIKVGFFCIQDLHNFIAPISDRLKKFSQFDVSEYWIKDFSGIRDKLMSPDVIWFEWANEVPIMLTDHFSEKLKDKTVILRIHSYEVLCALHSKINWQVIDHVVFVAEHIKTYCNINHPHQSVISNGIDLSEFKFNQKTHGDKIAFLAHLSSKKGVMLLAHAFAAMPANMQLHIGGAWTDERERVYFAHAIRELGIQDRVTYHGNIEHKDTSNFLSDKNYILVTSPWEADPVALCEAMATGCKPLVHKFWGADTLIPSDYLWFKFDELTQMVSPDSPFDAFAYRKFVKKYHDINDKVRRIADLISYVRSSK